MVYFGLDRYFNFIVTSEEAGFDKPHEAPFQIALEKMQPKGDVLWMIGDNPVNDIGGARAKINAITLQKIHDGVEKGVGVNTPHATFKEFKEVRRLLGQLSPQRP